MATLALPISELAPFVAEAKAEAKCVAVCSERAEADTITVWHVAQKVFALKRRFHSLVRRQGKLIHKLIEGDFSGSATNELSQIATSLDGLVLSEQELLGLVGTLSSVIRWWWRKSLATLSGQVDYLESISQSLHSAADPEASLLMGLAVQHIASQSAHERITA